MLVPSVSFTRASRRQVIGFLGVTLFLLANPANAQGGSPIPGGWSQAPSTVEPSTSAPLPGQDSGTAFAPSHGFSSGVPAATSKYAQLPLSIFDAKSRMQELRTMALVAKPQEVLEAVNRLSEWLGDMCDAHSKMASVFAKHDQTKVQALAEKQAVQKFSQVRNQAQLLKAELLMQQHRFPEALTPLVDIVIAEPTSATGMSAYGKLRELGFAEDPTPVAESSTPTAEAKLLPVKNPSTASASPIKRVH